MTKQRKIGFLQGRLTSSNGRGIQFFPYETWQDEFSIARDIGFSSIELLVKGDGYAKNPLWLKDGRKQIVKLAKEYGLSIPSVHGFTLRAPEYSQIATELVRFSHEVGARTVLVSFFNENVLQTKEDKQRAKERLLPAVRVAEGLGVRIAIEVEMPARQLLEFVSLFESSAVGIYYDIGNMVSMNVDVVEEIKLSADKIFGVHIKDRKKNNGPSVPIGEGNVDFSVVLGALNKVGYGGPYIMQGARHDNIDDITLNKSYYNFARDILANIKDAK